MPLLSVLLLVKFAIWYKIEIRMQPNLARPSPLAIVVWWKLCILVAIKQFRTYLKERTYPAVEVHLIIIIIITTEKPQLYTSIILWNKYFLWAIQQAWINSACISSQLSLFLPPQSPSYALRWILLPTLYVLVCHLPSPKTLTENPGWPHCYKTKTVELIPENYLGPRHLGQ